MRMSFFLSNMDVSADYPNRLKRSRRDDDETGLIAESSRGRTAHRSSSSRAASTSSGMSGVEPRGRPSHKATSRVASTSSGHMSIVSSAVPSDNEQDEGGELAGIESMESMALARHGKGRAKPGRKTGQVMLLPPKSPYPY